MNHLLRLLFVGCLLGIVSSVQPQSRNLGFSVIDEQGMFVKGLKVLDVRLRINKKDVAVESMDEVSDQALDLILLIDRSISQEVSIEKQKNAVKALIQDALKPGRDRVAVASFADKVVLHSDLSDDSALALNGLPLIKVEYPPGYVRTPGGNAVFVPPGGKPPTSGATALWDSIYDAAGALGSASSGDRRKVLLVFSDGYNTVGVRKRTEALNQVGLNGVAVFFVGIADPKFPEMDRKGLSRFAEEAAGLALFPNKKMSDVNEVAIRIVEAMRHSYSLTYSSPSSGNEVRISFPNRKGVVVSHHVN